MSKQLSPQDLAIKYAELLAKNLSSQNEERMNAEAEIVRLKDTDEMYPQALACIATAWQGLQNSVAIRQFAAVLLRQYVDKHCNEVSDGSAQFVLSDTMKQYLITFILPTLNEPNSEIRNANANVLATISKFEWKTMWGQVLPALVVKLASADCNEVLGALTVINSVCENASEKEFFMCAEQFIPTLIQIIRLPHSAAKCRMGAVECLSSCVTQIGYIGDASFNAKVIYCF